MGRRAPCLIHHLLHPQLLFLLNTSPLIIIIIIMASWWPLLDLDYLFGDVDHLHLQISSSFLQDADRVSSHLLPQNPLKRRKVYSFGGFLILVRKEVVSCSSWYGKMMARRGLSIWKSYKWFLVLVGMAGESLYRDEVLERRVFQFGKLLNPNQILQPPHIFGNLDRWPPNSISFKI